jgi:two-component system, OmpR family, alkaline phosphatase synthesis response regulator PhoP
MSVSTRRVLVVEDDAHLRFGLEFNLKKDGYEVTAVASAEEAEAALGHAKPDLAIFDIMLPAASGLDLLKAVRARGDTFPVLMLTARSDEADVVTSLALGADDYVRKPFGLAELLARIAAILRRWGKNATDAGLPPKLGPWTLDLANLRARSADVEVTLTNLEAELLSALTARPGDVHRREELLERIWGVSSSHLTRTLDNHVARLRKKLEVEPQNPRLILTVHGAGYKVAPPG